MSLALAAVALATALPEHAADTTPSDWRVMKATPDVLFLLDAATLHVADGVEGTMMVMVIPNKPGKPPIVNYGLQFACGKQRYRIVAEAVQSAIGGEFTSDSTKYDWGPLDPGSVVVDAYDVACGNKPVPPEWARVASDTDGIVRYYENILHRPAPYAR